jgi:protease-4
VIAILGIVFIVFIVALGVMITALSDLGGLAGGKITSLEKESFLVLRISGGLPDFDPAPNLGSLTSGKPLTVHSVVRALEHAKDDDKIKGVVLRPLGIGGFASIREIRESVRRFKESGKPVYAFAEIATDRDYYLASIADSIFLAPNHSGGLYLEGLGISSTYLARTFEKVGIKFNILHVGDYKGAFENWGQDQMSAPLRASLQSLVDDLYTTYTTETSQDRAQLSPTVLEQEMEHGEHLMITGQEALEKGFVDGLLDWQDFKDHIMQDTSEFAGVTVRDYLSSFSDKKEGKKKIAVVFAEGEISYSSGDSQSPFDMGENIKSAEFVQQLRELRDDEDVAAVVLRVNSPGGSALASKIILEEAKRVKAKKPLVVSMGRVAASGGYYIACGANEIIAQPNTITGSIGVVAMIPNLKGLYEKIGAREEVVKRGKWAEFLRVDQEFTEEQRVVLEYMLEDIYGEFRDDVAAGRNMNVEAVHEVAQGRVWTGAQALENGLVDRLGGLDLAISRARSLASLDSEQVQIEYFPKQQEIFEYLLDQLISSASLWQKTWLMTPEGFYAQRAIEYMDRFFESKEFAQTILPLNLVQ